MAGSKRQMLYITDIPNAAGDDKKRLILNVDESNAKLTGGLEYTPGNLGTLELASNKDFVRMDYRRLHLEGKTSGGKTVRRSIIACDPDNALVANGGTTVMGVMVGNESEAVTMFVSGVTGESRTIPKTTDTGLDDTTST
jgi:hypothetical protein